MTKISGLFCYCTNLSNLAWTEQDGKDEKLDTCERGERIECEVNQSAVAETPPA